MKIIIPCLFIFLIGFSTGVAYMVYRINKKFTEFIEKMEFNGDQETAAWLRILLNHFNGFYR